MRIIERHIYIDRITRSLNRDMMLVLVVQRRVGKSFMLKCLLQSIKDNYPKYVVSKEDMVEAPLEYPGICHIHLRQFLITEF